MTFACAHEQSWKEARKGLWTQRAPWMEADVRRHRQKVARCQITLCEGSLDRPGFRPQAIDIGGPGGRLDRRRRVPTRERYPRQFARHIFRVASGKAGDQEAAVALPKRQAGGPVGMGRTAAHGDVAMPRAAEGAYEIDQLLGGTVGDESHDVVPQPRLGVRRLMA